MTQHEHEHDNAATIQMWREVLEVGHQDKPSPALRDVHGSSEWRERRVDEKSAWTVAFS
jgi:hypothetical protein